MPTEIQNIVVLIVDGSPDTYTFIDYILVVDKGTKEKHWEKLRNVLGRLDKTSMQSNISYL